MDRDANDALREDGEEVVLGQLYGAPPLDPAIALFADAPVTPIGEFNGEYYFFSASGERRILKWRELERRAAILSLFGANETWLYETFPPGEEGGGWIVTKAAKALMAACVAEGIIDPHTVVRGPGIWPLAHSDALMHLGNQFLLASTGLAPHRIGVRRAGILYPASAPISPPGPLVASVADTRGLLDALRYWNIADPGGVAGLGAEVALGWLGVALLGGAPPWRPHLMVTGEAGTGKSWLAALLSAALGAAGHPSANEFTAAGLHQALTNCAMAMVLDEAEPGDAGGEKIQAVIEMIRKMSGRDGAKFWRGSAGGEARGFTITGAVYMSSILPGRLRPQDRTRITELTLARINAPGREVTAVAPRRGRDRVGRPALGRFAGARLPTLVALAHGVDAGLPRGADGRWARSAPGRSDRGAVGRARSFAQRGQIWRFSRV